MVDPRDLALAITAALQAKTPEPLDVDLWHHSPRSAAYLVEAVIEECRDAGIALAKVRVDRYVAVAMRRPLDGQSWSYRNIIVEIDATLFQRVAFHRST